MGRQRANAPAPANGGKAPMTREETKRCGKCGEDKSREDFYRHIRMKDGLTSFCKECHKAAVRAYQKANPVPREIARERERRWTARNREKRRAITRSWQQRNPDKLRESKAAWRTRNPEKIRAGWQQWARNNNRDREAARRYYAERRALEKAAFVEEVPFDFILQRDEGYCGICGEPIMEFTIELDHILPLVAGGMHERINVQLAHRSCNRAKGGRITSTS